MPPQVLLTVFFLLFLTLRLKNLTPHISLIAAGHTFKQLVTNLVMDLVNGQGELRKEFMEERKK